MGLKNRLDFIRKLYTTKLNCGKNLLELSTYNNIAMWWTVHPMFINVMSTENYFPARRAKYLIFLYKIAGPGIQAIYDIFIATILRLISDSKRRNSHEKYADKKIAFLTPNIGWGDTMDVETGQHRKGDKFFQTTIKELKNRGYSILGFYPVAVQPVRGMRTFIDKQKKWDVSNISPEIYLNTDVYREYLSSYKYFKNEWKILCNDATFRRMCIHNGNDEYNKIMGHLELYFVFLFPYLVREYELARLMIKSEKPSAMVMINEYGWIERTYLVAAKAEGVPVIAIQHGIIHQEHSGYIYNKDEISGDSLNSLYCPIPDKTAVSGKQYFDLLTKLSSYPEDSVVVTGQPRYDVLLNASKIYNKKKICEKHGINPSHRIVLWTTQCHGFSDDENYNNYDCVFKTINEIDNIALIVKQHPGESKRYTNKILDYIKKYKNENVILVPNNSDILELIYVCDLLIAKTSTTVIEAAAFNKPVIVLDLSEVKDTVGYVKDSIAIGVNKSDDLKTAILHLLDDASVLSACQKKYTANHLYKIDGKSSKRLADLIVKEIS